MWHNYYIINKEFLKFSLSEFHHNYNNYLPEYSSFFLHANKSHFGGWSEMMPDHKKLMGWRKTAWIFPLPIVERTSIDDATFRASSMLLNFNFIKSKFLQQMVSAPSWPLAFFSTCSTAACKSCAIIRKSVTAVSYLVFAAGSGSIWISQSGVHCTSLEWMVIGSLRNKTTDVVGKQIVLVWPTWRPSIYGSRL